MYEMMAFLAGAVLFIMQYQEPYCCLSFIYYYAFLLDTRYSVAFTRVICYHRHVLGLNGVLV